MNAMVEPQKRGTSFLDLVEANTPGQPNLMMCIQCGTCGGSCPSGPDMDHTPRKLFALIRAGQMEEVLKSNTPWYCVSCYLCTVRCPQDIHITDIMYTLKRMAIQKGLASENTAVDFSETFIGFMEENGRSFEFGLATRHYLRHRPMSIGQTATMGLGMLSQGRMEMTRTKIENLGQFQAIVRRAKELEAQS